MSHIFSWTANRPQHSSRGRVPEFLYVPVEVSLALEDRFDHRLAMAEFAAKAVRPPAVRVPCTPADFMRHINRQTLRLPEVAAQL